MRTALPLEVIASLLNVYMVDPDCANTLILPKIKVTSGIPEEFKNLLPFILIWLMLQ